jgi:hypothetical protein
VTHRPPPPPPPPSPLTGPYNSGDFCAYGDPTNWAGRCANLNSVPDGQTHPPGCPTKPARTDEIAAYPLSTVTQLANDMGVPIPTDLSGENLRTLLVAILTPMLLSAEGYP